MNGAVRKKMKLKVPLYRTDEEREGLRKASRFNAELMDFVRPQVKPGVTTLELDRIVHEYTRDHGHTPACLGYRGYPKTICTSVNEVVCHGIPNEKPLCDGDIVNIDLTTIVEGWYGDSSETVLIGNVSAVAKQLVQVTFECLWLGIRALQPSCKVVDIGRAIERHARQNRFEVVREYQGHGIGREFHQEPGIPHYVPVTGASTFAIEPGCCFTVEPMINIGTWRTFVDTRDGWTVRTLDLQLSAQFEHTILMTETGPEVLTLTKNGPQEGHSFI